MQTSEELKQETLILSDDKIFYTLEGEGEFIGKPSVFMRLSMCNLTCSAWSSPDSPNGCDSYISWSKKNKMTFEKIWDVFFADSGKGYARHLDAGAILKITGGEPLIQQKQLIKFVKYIQLKYREAYPSDPFPFTPQIDFETNATIMPDDFWVNEVFATFTTSPKLSTNGDPVEKTYKPDVLNWHAKQDSGFKFVITRSEDIDEVWEKYVIAHEIRPDRIWFMPCCGSRQEHIENAEAVAEYAKAMHVNFSPRLQLVIWDKALRV